MDSQNYTSSGSLLTTQPPIYSTANMHEINLQSGFPMYSNSNGYQGFLNQTGANLFGGANLSLLKSESTNGSTVTNSEQNNSIADVMSQLQKLQQIVAQSQPQQNRIGMNDQQYIIQQQKSIMNGMDAAASGDQSENSNSVQGLNQLQTQPQQQQIATNNPVSLTTNPMMTLMMPGFSTPNLGYIAPAQTSCLFPQQSNLGYDFSSQGGNSTFNPMLFGMTNMTPSPTVPWFPTGSVAAFHMPGPKNEIKLFVGGLQFQTMEHDLFQYFSKFGQVGDTIVMRDKLTGRGRGFGFVKMVYKDEEEALKAKQDILSYNVQEGHFILDKKVDVKSADDYQGKQQQQQTQIPIIPQQQQPQSTPPIIQKPNPYAIAEAKGDEADVVYKYPKSKIFVGGLDFKLTVEELRQHFTQYGEVHDACVLKDIYTGQSRGFGFVTFKEEEVAQNLIHNIQVTTINGRKADIKKAEVKMGGPSFIPHRPHHNQMMPAMIPPYSGSRDDSYSSGSRDQDYFQFDRDDRGRHRYNVSQMNGNFLQDNRNNRQRYRRSQSRDDDRSESRDNRRGSGRGGRYDNDRKRPNEYRHREDSRGRRRRSRSRSNTN